MVCLSIVLTMEQKLPIVYAHMNEASSMQIVQMRYSSGLCAEMSP